MAVRVRSRGVRVVRGLTVAILSVSVAAFSHVAAGGVAPGALGVILALTFAILACIALGSRALSPVRLSLSVGLSQIVFHVLFSLGADVPVGAGEHGSIGMLGMVMSGGHTTLLPNFATPSGVSAATISDARMWFGHAMAAVVTVVVLLHGERALLNLVRLGGARLARLVVVVEGLPASLGVARHSVLAALGDRRGLRPLELLLTSRPHRGPPVSA